MSTATETSRSHKKKHPNPNEGKQSLEYRDTRAPIKTALVETLLTAAGAAVVEEAKYERFNMPLVWGTLRQTFHTLDEKTRRLCLLKLLIEESQRLEHDRASSF